MYQVILIRTDLGMRCGKKIAQGAHASVLAAHDAFMLHPKNYAEWIVDNKFKKVALRVKNEKDLLDIYQVAKEKSLPCARIWDEGLTQIEPSFTAVAIGPCEDSILDKLTGGLKLV